MRHSIEHPLKLSARAVDVLGTKPGNAALTLELAAAFAAQNPGFDPANYGGHVAGYRADSRRAQRGLRDCREAMRLCLAAGVNDGDMIEASRGERFEITGDAAGGYSAHYTAGQYWCTEFRFGVARVLEQAARIAMRRNGRAS